ncbi:uncharacterized protein BX663DRAFT_492593 [Cokeromyces recurvatus]|uniref:uncharacterized protein n=1 Tax=Cokeromyces recurvatus TaxID=90255 RepID=UPI002220E842|nr:uncharacterized protein BX663DRAFT_492593 [Cokeromyces recurvatus]KAI7907973.1 hypothetical protein BX663DRAFT_492593 [Cokeromyces recurvatus]
MSLESKKEDKEIHEKIVIISNDSESEFSSFSLKEDSILCTQETSSTLVTSSSNNTSPPTSVIVREKPQKIRMRQVKTTKSIEMLIPESKSNSLLPTVLFACQVTCIHYLSYYVYLKEEEPSVDMNKLDIILASNGSIHIQCSFLLNGLENVLEYPLWFQTPLNKVMADCGFIHNQTENDGYCLHYKIKKAFVTTPLSYLLDKKAPYGTLDKIEIIFDWIPTQSKEFQSTWKRKFNLDLIGHYIEQAFTNIIIKKTSYMYPLIFSNYYTKKITGNMSYLPNIAQSLYKIYITSRSTMSVNNHDFSESILQKLKVIKKNTMIMNPYDHDDEEDIGDNMIPTYLILGMYYSIKNALLYSDLKLLPKY